MAQTYSPAKTVGKGAAAATSGMAGGGLGLLIIGVLRSIGVDIPVEAEAGIIWLSTVLTAVLVRVVNNWRKHGLGSIAGMYGCLALATLAGLLLGGAGCAHTTQTLPDGTVVERWDWTVTPDEADAWLTVADRLIARLDSDPAPSAQEQARRAAWEGFKADLAQYLIDRALGEPAVPPVPPEPVRAAVIAETAETPIPPAGIAP